MTGLRMTPRPGVQAWLLARLAAERGLRFELGYGCLGEDGGDDPEPFEPEEEDLKDIERWIGEIGAAIAASDFQGVADPLVCRRCSLSRACPDAEFDDERM